MAFLFLLPFSWTAQNLYNLGGDDSRLYFYSPIDWLKSISFYSWFAGYFGSHSPQQAYLPLNIFSLALKHLFPFLNLQTMLYGLILSFSFLVIFLILKELLKTKDRASFYAAILGGLSYVFSPLIYYSQWTFPLSSLIGIVGYPLIFFLFFKALRKQRIEYLVIGALISLAFSILLFYVSLSWLAAFLIGISLFYLFYIIFFPEQLKLVIKYSLIYIFFIILINALWLLPESFSFFQQAQLTVTSALSVSGREMGIINVNAVASSMNIFDTLLNLLSRGLIYNFNWPQSRIAGYTYGLAPLSLFLPLIVFLPLLLKNKERKKEDTTILKFWFALAIPTILLAYLQTVDIWKVGINFFNLLMRYLPGWTLLRNFYHKVPPSYVFFYSLTLGVSLYIISKSVFKESVKRAVFVIIFLVVILQALPFIRGAINNLPFRLDAENTMNVELPSYYFEALDTIKGLEEGKVLSLPLTFASWSLCKSKEGNGIYIGFSPILVFTGRNDFNGAFAFFDGEKFIPSLTSIVKEAMQKRDYEFLGKLFGLLNLKYIFYNSEIYEDKTLEKIRQTYLWGVDDFQTKDNIESLIKGISNKRIGKFGPVSIYELSGKYYYPTIYSTNKVFLDEPKDNLTMLFTGSKLPLLNQEPQITFNKINPTKYLVKVEEAKEPFWLVFSESFDKLWRLYRPSSGIGFQLLASDKIEATYPNLKVKEAKHLMKFTPEDIKYLFKKPLGAQHELVNSYANGWYIEPDKLGLNKDFTLVIYFWPQSLFYLGLGISGLTFLSCIVYLLWPKKKIKSH